MEVAQLNAGAGTATAENSELKKDIDKAWLENWSKRADHLFTDLTTSNRDLREFMLESLASGKDSPYITLAIQSLMAQREQVTQLLTNVIRSFGQTARSVIGNMRT